MYVYSLQQDDQLLAWSPHSYYIHSVVAWIHHVLCHGLSLDISQHDPGCLAGHNNLTCPSMPARNCILLTWCWSSRSKCKSSSKTLCSSMKPSSNCKREGERNRIKWKSRAMKMKEKLLQYQSYIYSTMTNIQNIYVFYLFASYYAVH